MSRTERRVRNRLPWDEVGFPERYTAHGPEKACKPHCGCRAEWLFMGQSKKRRRSDRRAIREQVEDVQGLLAEYAWEPLRIRY